VREDEPAKLMAETIIPIERYNPAAPQDYKPDPVREAAQRVYIRLPSRSSREYDKVINLLGIFDGNIPVILCLQDEKKKLAVPRRLYTSGHPLFYQELERLLGAGNVATK